MMVVFMQPLRAQNDMIFDSAALKNMLAPGTCTINGKIKYKGDFKGLAAVGGGYTASGCKVTLLPVTPYMEKWHLLILSLDKDFIKHRKDYDQGRFNDRIGLEKTMGTNLHRYSLQAVSDKYGKFKFTALKPGKYFLCAYPAGIHHSGDYYTGGGAAGPHWVHRGSMKYYRVEEYVNIEKENQVIDVTMKKSILVESQSNSDSYR